MADDYRKAQEEFVSDHSGTTVLEISLIVSIAPLSVFLRNIVSSWFMNGHLPTTWNAFMSDFTMLIVPTLLCFTIGASYVDTIFTTIIFMILGIIAFQESLAHKTKNGKRKNFTVTDLCEHELTGHRPFISSFRAYVNIATAVSILAVDFGMFPRRFCKAETYGTGLMDVGVGAFVISNAIVSPDARGKHLGHRTFGSRIHSVAKAVKSSLPLLVLGFARLLAVKGTDYQEHVSEYGVHWNFFFTLAMVKILSTVVTSIVDPSWSFILSIIISCGYQYILTGLGYTDYVLMGAHGDGSRGDIFDANREGIFSSLGYLGIYFAGVQLGMFLFAKRNTFKDWCWALATLIFIDVCCWISLLYIETYIESVSRRMANLGYVVWMLAYNIQLIASFLLFDLIYESLEYAGIMVPKSGSVKTKGVEKKKGEKEVESQSKKDTSLCLLDAVNRNGLFYFLFANILTGLVNFSMKTIYASDFVGFSVVSGYMFVLSIVTFCLHIMDISLKVW